MGTAPVSGFTCAGVSSSWSGRWTSSGRWHPQTGCPYLATACRRGKVTLPLGAGEPNPTPKIAAPAAHGERARGRGPLPQQPAASGPRLSPEHRTSNAIPGQGVGAHPCQDVGGMAARRDREHGTDPGLAGGCSPRPSCAWGRRYEAAPAAAPAGGPPAQVSGHPCPGPAHRRCFPCGDGQRAVARGAGGGRGRATAAAGRAAGTRRPAPLGRTAAPVPAPRRPRSRRRQRRGGQGAAAARPPAPAGR